MYLSLHFIHCSMVFRNISVVKLNIPYFTDITPCFTSNNPRELYELYLAHEKLADTDSVIIPYMAMNWRFITLYGIITGPLSAYYSCGRYKHCVVGTLRQVPDEDGWPQLWGLIRVHQKFLIFRAQVWRDRSRWVRYRIVPTFDNSYINSP